MDYFHYLKVGLAAILGFVGVKMVLPAVTDWHISPYVSLAVIAGVLVASVGLSLAFPRNPQRSDVNSHG